MSAERKFMVLGFILSLFLGTSFVILLNSPIQENRSSLIAREIVSQINEEKKALQHQERRVKELEEEYKKIQKNKLNVSDLLSESEEAKYNDFKMRFGRETIIGEGIIILLESEDSQNNIAFTFDTNRLLLKITNLAKRKGAEVVAINNQLITGNSGIVLAGNHINVNNIPITPPYEVKLIGNEKTLYRFFSEESVFMLSLEKNYGITSKISRSRNIQVPKIHFSREYEWIKEAM